MTELTPASADTSIDSETAYVPDPKRLSRTNLIPSSTDSPVSTSAMPRKKLNDGASPAVPAPRPKSQFSSRLAHLYTKYYRILLMCHFLFILFNCGILIPLTYVIHPSEITTDLEVAYQSVLFCRYLAIENCNELSSVWWYAAFNGLSICLNLVLLVMEEFKHLTDAREEVIRYYTRDVYRKSRGPHLAGVGVVL
ncbi:hypothetical protein HDU98_011233 [Podochytrium sp. JEL0797]|nr:hypothetical protein HDU98_011233 [Podochytrium sp. JEL0797]